jgi:hypothetical protein
VRTIPTSTSTGHHRTTWGEEADAQANFRRNASTAHRAIVLLATSMLSMNLTKATMFTQVSIFTIAVVKSTPTLLDLGSSVEIRVHVPAVLFG